MEKLRKTRVQSSMGEGETVGEYLLSACVLSFSLGSCSHSLLTSVKPVWKLPHRNTQGFVSMVILNSINVATKLKHHGTVYIFICGFSIPLVYMLIFMPVPRYFVYIDLWYSLKSGILMPSSFVHFTQDCFGYWGSFMVPYGLYVFFFFSVLVQDVISYSCPGFNPGRTGTLLTDTCGRPWVT